jgi:hypothetical protein
MPDQPNQRPSLPAQPTPQPSPSLDVAAERDAYRALIEFVMANKDADTAVVHVSLDEYLAGLE